MCVQDGLSKLDFFFFFKSKPGVWYINVFVQDRIGGRSLILDHNKILQIQGNG